MHTRIAAPTHLLDIKALDVGSFPHILNRHRDVHNSKLQMPVGLLSSEPNLAFFISTAASSTVSCWATSVTTFDKNHRDPSIMIIWILKGSRCTARLEWYGHSHHIAEHGGS